MTLRKADVAIGNRNIRICVIADENTTLAWIDADHYEDKPFELSESDARKLRDALNVYLGEGE